MLINQFLFGGQTVLQVYREFIKLWFSLSNAILDVFMLHQSLTNQHSFKAPVAL